eukprot:PhF_6_TR35122/c0_g1_i2/m.51202
MPICGTQSHDSQPSMMLLSPKQLRWTPPRERRPSTSSSLCLSRRVCTTRGIGQPYMKLEKRFFVFLGSGSPYGSTSSQPYCNALSPRAKLGLVRTSAKPSRPTAGTR